ncbi:MAG: hypothetical protein K0Q73_9163 [Paenibacillus sp.]|jgi:hypothetical protein|nr:hypothetical protein [Paenibacillus sp.]
MYGAVPIAPARGSRTDEEQTHRRKKHLPGCEPLLQYRSHRNKHADDEHVGGSQPLSRRCRHAKLILSIGKGIAH